MNENGLEHKIQLPGNSLCEFVERFWMVRNTSREDHQIVIVPDGRIDLMFITTNDEPFASHIIGKETEPSKHTVTQGTKIMGVGLKLLAVEYCLKYSIAPTLCKTMPLASPDPGVIETDLNRFQCILQQNRKGFYISYSANYR